MVDPSPPADATYQWNTGGCFINDRHYYPTCFPTGQTTQNVTGNNLLAKDAGTITCSATIGDVDYTSGPLTLHISGICCIHLLCMSNLAIAFSLIRQVDESPSLVNYCVNHSTWGMYCHLI